VVDTAWGAGVVRSQKTKQGSNINSEMLMLIITRHKNAVNLSFQSFVVFFVPFAFVSVCQQEDGILSQPSEPYILFFVPLGVECFSYC